MYLYIIFYLQVINCSCTMAYSHRSVKWWKRVFFHLLDLSLVNSHIVFKAATSSKISLLEFRTSVATSLLEGLDRPRNRHAASTPKLPL